MTMKKIISIFMSGFLMILTSCGVTPESSQKSSVNISNTSNQFANINTTVGEVISNPAFEDFGRLLFPVDRTVTDDMTLAEISTSRVYTWYNNIQSDKTVEIINVLAERAENGQQIFYRKNMLNADIFTHN